MCIENIYKEEEYIYSIDQKAENFEFKQEEFDEEKFEEKYKTGKDHISKLFFNN